MKRSHIQGRAVEPLARALTELRGRLPTREELTVMVERMGAGIPAATGPGPAEPVLDYVALAERHRGGKNRRKPGAR